MNTAQLPKRDTETFIVAKTEEGFRVCSPLNPATQYVVSGTPPTCTCPDFAHDPDTACGHIRAAEKYQAMQNHHQDGDAPPAPAVTEAPKPRKPVNRTGEAIMLLKRSISPDGRIDSLSVEFSCPVGKTSSEEIKQSAERALRLQADIIAGFLKTVGNGKARITSQNGAAPAHLLTVGEMNTRQGRRMFLNVFVNGQVARLFGTKQELGEALAAAGFADQAATLADGAQLNLSCRAVTKRNGKYLNIEQLLPNGG